MSQEECYAMQVLGQTSISQTERLKDLSELILYFLKHTDFHSVPVSWQPSVISESKFGSHNLKTTYDKKSFEIHASTSRVTM